MNADQIDETLNILHKAENYGFNALTLEENKRLIMNTTSLPLDVREQACRDLEETYND